MKMLKSVFEFVFGKKKQELEYPSDFAIIDYSSVALENGIKDDQNKVIYRYKYDRFGYLLEVKEYHYTKEVLYALEEIHQIPVYDKTQKEARFPIFGKILPQEVSYTLKE